MDELIDGFSEFSKLGVVNLKKKDMKTLFHAIDVNNSGEIDYTEFIASFLGTKATADEKYLKATF